MMRLINDFCAALLVLLCLLALVVHVNSVPSNDVCENAIVLLPNDNAIVTGSTVDATVDEPNLCGENLVTSPGVWYFYQSTDKDTVAHVSTCTSQTNFDTALTVYEGADCSSLSCVVGRDDDLECDSGTEQHSTVSWQASAGQGYYILVHGSEADHSGDFGLIVSESEPLTSTSSAWMRSSQQFISICFLPILGAVVLFELLW